MSVSPHLSRCASRGRASSRWVFLFLGCLIHEAVCVYHDIHTVLSCAMRVCLCHDCFLVGMKCVRLHHKSRTTLRIFAFLQHSLSCVLSLFLRHCLSFTHSLTHSLTQSLTFSDCLTSLSQSLCLSRHTHCLVCRRSAAWLECSSPASCHVLEMASSQSLDHHHHHHHHQQQRRQQRRQRRQQKQTCQLQHLNTQKGHHRTSTTRTARVSSSSVMPTWRGTSRAWSWMRRRGRSLRKILVREIMKRLFFFCVCVCIWTIDDLITHHHHQLKNTCTQHTVGDYLLNTKCQKDKASVRRNSVAWVSYNFFFFETEESHQTIFFTTEKEDGRRREGEGEEFHFWFMLFFLKKKSSHPAVSDGSPAAASSIGLESELTKFKKQKRNSFY